MSDGGWQAGIELREELGAEGVLIAMILEKG